MLIKEKGTAKRPVLSTGSKLNRTLVVIFCSVLATAPMLPAHAQVSEEEYDRAMCEASQQNDIRFWDGVLSGIAGAAACAPFGGVPALVCGGITGGLASLQSSHCNEDTSADNITPHQDGSVIELDPVIITVPRPQWEHTGQ